MTNAVSLAQQASTGVSQGFKNRIINGAMVIAQRTTSAVTNDSSDALYPVDRFFIYGNVNSKFTAQQNAGSVTPPAGFTNYVGITSLSSYSVGASDTNTFGQPIEGFNTADLNWGTANAKTVTLSFWVRSSLTGTFGGSLLNSAQNRSYPFSYTISSANTWEQKSVTIAGDTSGTWVGATNGVGIRVVFGLGVGSTYSGTAGAWSSSLYYAPTGATSVVGTNGATFYITGVQLEVGSTATSFEYLDYGRSLIQCQRYFQSVGTTADIAYGSSGTAPMRITAVNNGGSQPLTGWQYPVAMRATPSIQTYGAGVAGGNFVTNDSGSGSATQSSFSSTDIGFKGCRINLTGRSNSAYQYWVDCGTGSGQLGWTQSAEL